MNKRHKAGGKSMRKKGRGIRECALAAALIVLLCAAAPGSALAEETDGSEAVTAGSAEEKADFSDVSDSSPWYDAVQWAYSNHYAYGTGNGLFSPDKNCSRGEIVTFLWREAGNPSPADGTSPEDFIDVKADSPYYDAVRWASSVKIAAGYGSGIFGVDDECTRDQIITFLWRYGASSTEATDSYKKSFSDVTQETSGPYYTAILWGANNDIIFGIGNNMFGGSRTCTRGEAVTFLYRESQYEEKQKAQGTSGTKTPSVKPGGEAASSGIAKAEAPAGTIFVDGYADELVSAINQERQAAGVTPVALTVSSDATEAARARAIELTKNFTHRRPDGSDFYTSFSDAGLTASQVSGAWIGENIAYGYATPEEVMSAWMNASNTEHKEYILSKYFTSVGTACLYDPASYTFYWVQEFIGSVHVTPAVKSEADGYKAAADAYAKALTDFNAETGYKAATAEKKAELVSSLAEQKTAYDAAVNGLAAMSSAAHSEVDSAYIEKVSKDFAAEADPIAAAAKTAEELIAEDKASAGGDASDGGTGGDAAGGSTGGDTSGDSTGGAGSVTGSSSGSAF